MAVRKKNKTRYSVSLIFWNLAGGVIASLLLVMLVWLFVRPTPSDINAVTITNPVDITFQPSSEDIANPERGFMKQSSIYVDQPLDPTKVRALASTDTLVWIYFRLDNYRDPRDGYGQTVANYQGRAIDALGLATVRAAFATAREKGLKLVIRFIYNPGPGSSSNPLQVNPDVPVDLALQHIEQLRPIIAENTDVIAAMQAGFVGHWGEWHSSKYLGDTATRKRIVDALLTALPKDRMLLLRYPRYKQFWYGGPLTEQTAYNQSDLARVGTHDDAFLKDETDDGTFKSNSGGVAISNYCQGSSLGDTECWRRYVNEDTRFTAVGGEASVPNAPRSTCGNVQLQMANMHWSFINNGFNTTVLGSWTSGGCMSEIRQRLGYRLVLNKLTVSRQVNPGGTLGLRLEVDNKGFAAPYNPRPVFVVLKNNTTGTSREIPVNGIDPRRFTPGQVTIAEANVNIPADLPAGAYSLSLFLPDAYSSLKTRPAYAIRLANAEVWQPDTGHNLLYRDLAVGGNVIIQSPSPQPSVSSTPLPSKTPSPSPSPSPIPSRSPSPSPEASAYPKPSASATSQPPSPSLSPSISPIPTASGSPHSSVTSSPGSVPPSNTPGSSSFANPPASATSPSFVDFMFGLNRAEKIAADIQANQQGGSLWAWLTHIGRESYSGPDEGDYNWNGKVEVADLFILIKNIFRGK